MRILEGHALQPPGLAKQGWGTGLNANYDSDTWIGALSDKVTLGQV